MTLTTSTTHGTSTVTARLDTETLRVSLDVDGTWAGEGRWSTERAPSGCIVGCGPLFDDDDTTNAAYCAIEAGLRAQLAAKNLKAEDAYEYMARTNAWYDCGGAEGEVVDENDPNTSLSSLAVEFVSDAAATGVLIDRAEVERYVRARYTEYLAAQAERAKADGDR